MERAWVSNYDSSIAQTIRQVKQVIVLINYIVNGKRAEKVPDKNDFELITKIEKIEIPHWFPINRIPLGEKTPETHRIGLTHQNHMYSKRSLFVLSQLFSKLQKNPLKLAFQSIVSTLCSKMVRYNFGNRGNGILTGTIYVPSLFADNNVLKTFAGKIKDFSNDFIVHDRSLVSTSSTDSIKCFDESLDYVFVDPPFGSNLIYSELNLFWESWLKVWTDNKFESIESKKQGKGITEYRHLMAACFKETYRVLKPGHWMTVEFSNTKASVWNAIQMALIEAGFIVANVSALDKKQGSFNAVTNTTSVKQDLVISAYKPNGGFEERFQEEAQTEEGVWDFIRTHLKYLPVVKRGTSTHLVSITERDPRILFDQMVAYFVRKGFPVPLNSAAFQEGLSQRFSYRDGMYFLSEQVAEYDKKKLTAGGMEHMSLFVSDESSAIDWLRQLLKDKPQSFQDIHPQFIKELGGWQKYEKQLELSELLEQNFLRYDGNGEVPNQIHGYLSTNFKELRNLPKDNPSLRAKAKDRWYVPDPNKMGDLDKLRERSLLREFVEYKQSAQKRLKILRLEAVRAGFKKAWQDHDYTTIVTVTRKIPENILQEDPKLLLWYDQAVTRMGE